MLKKKHHRLMELVEECPRGKNIDAHKYGLLNHYWIHGIGITCVDIDGLEQIPSLECGRTIVQKRYDEFNYI